MLNILAITGPIYLIVAIGFLAVRFGVFGTGDMRTLGRFVIHCTLPALLFLALAERSITDVLNAGFLAAYASGAVVVMLAVVAYLRFGQGKSMPYAGLAGLGSSFSNTAFIGYPILAQFPGMSANVALALAMIVDNLLVLPLALTLMEGGNDQGGRWGQALGQSLVRLARNPLIIAIGAGFAFALSGIRLPFPAARTLELLAMASTGMALFVVGGSLAGVRVRGMLRGLMEIAAAKLVLHPLAVAGLLLLLPTIDPALRVAAVILACMPTLSILPILAQKHDLEGFCAAALLVTTVVSFVTINAALWILRRLGAV